jgi:hypothetical protein
MPSHRPSVLLAIALSSFATAAWCAPVDADRKVPLAKYAEQLRHVLMPTLEPLVAAKLEKR